MKKFVISRTAGQAIGVFAGCLILAGCDPAVEEVQEESTSEEVSADGASDDAAADVEVSSVKPIEEAQKTEMVAKLAVEAEAEKLDENQAAMMRVLWDGIPIRMSAWQLNRLIAAGVVTVDTWIGGGCPPTFPSC